MVKILFVGEESASVQAKSISPSVLSKMGKSICKIIYKKNILGTGFLIRFYKKGKELFCFMANEHIIIKEMIESKEIIHIYYDEDKKMIKLILDEKERYIVYNKEMDITIIEIKDFINEKDYFLYPKINDDLNYLNKDVFMGSYNQEGIVFSSGTIKSMNGYKFTHSMNYDTFSSGSPIFLFNTTEVIGISIPGTSDGNYGTLINSVILFLNNRLEIYQSGNYYIGPIKNRLRSGKGIEYYKNGDIKYEGYFVNDKYEGDGK